MRGGGKAPPTSTAYLEKMTQVFSLKQDILKAFEHADQEEKGFLTREDYKVAVLELLGYKPSKYELDSVWSGHVGCQGDDCPGMNKNTFITVLTKRLLQKDPDELIRQVFVSFDVHLNGFLTVECCKQVFEEVAPGIKHQLIERWFHEVDSDGDGRVTYRDFELMMKSYILLEPPQK